MPNNKNWMTDPDEQFVETLGQNRTIYDTVEGEFAPVSTLIDEEETSHIPFAGGNVAQYLGTAGSSKYDENLSRQNVEYYEQFRGENQPGIAQLGSALNQAIVGQILGGTIEGVGYLLDLPQYFDLANGTEKEFTNWFSDIGRSLQTWTQEATPIYTTYEPGSFSPGHWSWWMNNAPSVASTLSLAFSSGAVVRGLSAISKFTKFTKVIEDFGKFINITPLQTRWSVKGITQAIVSRDMETMMDSYQTYEGIVNEALEKGMNPEEAKKKASIGASNVYRLEWASLAQDIPQYLLLNKSFSRASLDNTIDVARKMGKSIAPVVGKKAAAIGWDMLTEGGEEVFQYIAQKEGEYQANIAYDPSLKSSFSDRLEKYVADGDLWTQGFFGAIGAGVVQTAGKAINQVITGKRDPRMEDIQSWGSQFSYWNQRMKEAQVDGDLNAERFAKDALWTTLGTKSAYVGNTRNAMDFLEAMKNPTPEELENFGINEDDLKVFQTEIPKGLEKIKRIERIYNDNSKQYEPEKAQLVTYHEALLEDQIANRNRLQSLVNEDRNKIPNLDILPPHVRDYLFYNIDSRLIQKRIGFFEKALKRSETEHEKVKYQNNIDQLKSKLNTIEEAKSEILSIGEISKSYIEKYLPNLTSKALEDYRKHSQELEYSRHAISDLQSDLEKVKKDDFLSTPEERFAYNKQVEDETKEAEIYQPSIDDIVIHTNEAGENKLYRLAEVDETGDATIIPVNEAGLPTGEDNIIVDRNNLTLYQKEGKDAEDLEQPEIVNEDEVPELERKLYDENRSTSRGLRDVSGSVSHSHWDDKQKETIVRNKSFDTYISNPTNELKRDQVSFSIDTSVILTTDDPSYKKKLESTTGYINNKLNNGETFTKTEIDNIINSIKTTAGEDKYNSAVDILSIKLTYKTASGEVFDSGLYYHDTDFIRKYSSGRWNIYIPSKILREGNVEEYVKAEREKVRQNRRILITALLSGKEVILRNINKTIGIPNNTKVNRHIDEVLKQNANEIILGIADKTGTIWTGHGKDSPPMKEGLTQATPGNVFFETQKTCNGESAVVKCNASKLSAEHAGILWDVLLARSHKGSGGNQAIFKSDLVEGLTIGQILNLLTTFGPRTNINHPNKLGKMYLEDKQLFIDNKLFLHYGKNSVHLGDVMKGKLDKNIERSKFIDWATEYKNYSINKEISDLGIVLNKPMTKKFKLGSWVSDGTDTYTGSLIKNGIVQTDVLEFENTGSLFHAPVTIIDISESGYEAIPAKPIIEKAKDTVTEVKTQSNKKSKNPKNTGTKKVESSTSKTEEVTVKSEDLDKLKSLPVGTDIYINTVKTIEEEEIIIPTLFLSVVDLNGSKFYKIKSPRIRSAFGISIESYKIDPEPLIEIDDKSSNILSNILTNWENYTITVPKDTKESLYNELEKDIEETPGFGEIKPTEETPPIPESPTFIGDPNPLTGIQPGGEAPFRLAYTDGVKYKIIDINKELKWFKDKLGIDVPIEIVNGLIYIAKTGKKAFGQLRRDGILLSNVAEEGTLYHEAFHRVSLLYLDDISRNEIYDEARKKYKDKTLSNKNVEERLAEEFRDYIIKKEADVTYGIMGKIGKFFKNLYLLIKKVFTGSNRLTDSNINKLFESIATDKFRTYKPLEDNLNKLGFGTYELEYRDRQLVNVINFKHFKSILKGLSSMVLKDVRNKLYGKTESRTPYSTIDIKDSLASIDFNSLKSDIQKRANEYGMYATFNSWVLSTIEKGNLSPKLASQLKDNYKVDTISKIAEKAHQYLENALRLNSLYEEIVDNYDLYKDKLQDYIAVELNIRKINKEEEDERVDNRELVKYDKESYQYSAKDTIANSIKFLVSNLHESIEVDPLTGFYKFAEFDEVWSRIMNDLHNLDTIEDMIKVLSSIDNYFPYQQLSEKLKNGSELLRTQFFTSIKKHRHSFVNVMFKEEVQEDKTRNFSLYFTDADIQNAAKNAIRIWTEAFVSSNLFDNDKLDIKKLSKIFSDYDSLKKDYGYAVSTKSLVGTKEYKDRLLSILSDLHIDIRDGKDSNMTIDNLLSNIMKSGRAGTEESALLRLLNDDMFHLFSDNSTLIKYAKGEKFKLYGKLVDPKNIDPKKLLGNESIISDIARSFAELNYTDVSDNVPGAEGNNHHVFAENSYVTDVVHYLKTDDNYLNNLLKDVYSKYSIYLNQIKTDNNIRDSLSVKTFNAFIKDESTDLGRSYLDITPIEDFVYKLNLIRNGYFVFPTMASRRTYYMLKGLKRIELKYQKEGETLHIPDEIIDTFYNYFLAEQNRITQAYETLRKYSKIDENGNIIKGSTDFTYLVENYHYVTEGKEKHISKGLAYKYQHMFANFNKKGFDFNEENIRKEIRSILESDIDETIKFTNKNNITKIEDGKLVSVLLDNVMINRLATESYGNDKNAALRSILADFTINTKISSIETMMMFMGDIAFYKQDNNGNPSEDYAKRLAVLTSSGTIPRETIPIEYESSIYNVSTLSEQKLKSDYYNLIREKQKKLLMEKYKDETLVDNILKKVLRDYDDRGISPTDAMVVIIPDMFRGDSIRRGKWGDKEEEAFNLLQSTEDISKLKEQELLNIVMQPLKHVYFDRVAYDIDDNNILLIPIYDKMAIFTLHRRYVAGTYMEELLDRMELKGKYAPGAELNKDGALEKICMVKFDSAVKVGNRLRTEYFNNPNKSDQSINDLTKLAVYYQKFKFLRNQTATDPHEMQKVLLASQFKKISMSNIDDNSIYILNDKEINGIELKKNINTALSILSDKEIHKLLDKLGVDNEGKVNDNLFYEALLADAKTSGMPENVQETIRRQIPIDLLPERKWIFQRFASMINKYGVDVHLPGQQLIQMSGFGLGAKSITDQTNNLKFLFDNEGNLAGSECKVSVQVFKDIIPGYYNKSWNEKVEWLKNNPNVLEGIGYRIPNQGLSSSIFLKISEFLPEQSGDVIILPNEFTSLTGSDFDVDKVFLVRYNYRIDKDGKVSKVPFMTDDNSTIDERYNKLIKESFYDNNFIFTKESYKDLKEVRSIYYNSLAAKARLLGEDGVKLSTLLDLRKELERKYDESSEKERDFYHRQLMILNSRINDITYYNNVINETKDELDEFNTIIENVLVKYNILPSREMFKQLHKNGDINYFQQNTKQAIQNYYLDNIKSIMLSDNHFLSTSAPLGAVTNRLKVLASKVKEAEQTGLQKSFDFTGPIFQSNLKFNFGSGALGKGSFSLSNSHHIMCQLAKVSFNKDLKLGKAINGKTSLYEKYGKVERDGQEILISDWGSALIDSHVDIEKDPYIISLNVIPPTYNVVQLLTRLGYGERTFEFTSQPILKDLSNEMINEVKEGNELGLRKFEKPIDIILDRWERYYEESLSKSNQTKDLRDKEDIRIKEKLMNYNPLEEDLLNLLQTSSKDSEWYYKQLVIARTFDKINKGPARDLNRLVMASRVDTKKWGSNLIETKMYIDSIRDLYSDNLFDNLDKILPFDPETSTSTDIDGGTFNSAYLRNGPLLFTKLMSDKTITATKPFNDLVDRIVTLSKNKYSKNKEGLMNNIADEIHTAFLSRFFTDKNLLNLDSKKAGNVIGRVIHFLDTVNTNPKYKESLKNNSLIQSLIRGKSVIDGLVFYGIPTIKSDDNFIKEDLTFAWQELLESDDVNLRNFAKELFIYSFYTSGFKRGLYSIFHYIPPVMFNELEINYTDENGESKNEILNFSEFVEGLIYSLNDPDIILSIIEGIDKEVFRNNWHNPKYVQQLYPNDLQNIIFTSKTKRPAVVTISDRNSIKKLYLGDNELNQPIYKPYINHIVDNENSYLMEYIGFHSDKSPVYKLVNKFGYYNKGRIIKEYGLEQSMFKRNQITTISDDVAISTISKDNSYQTFEYVSPENRELVVNKRSDEELSETSKLASLQDDTTKMTYTTTEDRSLNVGAENALKLSPSNIYSQLGNKTESGNVVIHPWSELKDLTEPFGKVDNSIVHIISTRIKNSNEHFGNPFSSDEKVLAQNPSLIKTNSTKESVEKYIDWIINSKDSRAKWIREQIKSGELKDKPIFYYKELGEPSHATALDYLINKYNWNSITITQEQLDAINNKFKDNPITMDEFNAMSKEEQNNLLNCL